MELFKSRNNHVLRFAIFQLTAGINDEPPWIKLIPWARMKDRVIDALEDIGDIGQPSTLQYLFIPAGSGND